MADRFRWVLLGVLLIAGSAEPAPAAVVDLTWTGVTAFGGSDGLGLFGPAGVMPANTSYTARYRFDTTIGFIDDPVNAQQTAVGGTFFDPDKPLPLVSASVTINGATVSEVGDYYSEYIRRTGLGSSLMSALAQRSPSALVRGELFQRVGRNDGNFYTLPLGQPGEFNFTASDGPGGEIARSNHDANGNIIGPTTQIQLVPSHLSITLVPEPTTCTLALMSALALAQLFKRRR